MKFLSPFIKCQLSTPFNKYLFSNYSISGTVTNTKDTKMTKTYSPLKLLNLQRHTCVTIKCLKELWKWSHGSRSEGFLLEPRMKIQWQRNNFPNEMTTESLKRQIEFSQGDSSQGSNWISYVYSPGLSDQLNRGLK